MPGYLGKGSNGYERGLWAELVTVSDLRWLQRKSEGVLWFLYGNKVYDGKGIDIKVRLTYQGQPRTCLVDVKASYCYKRKKKFLRRRRILMWVPDLTVPRSVRAANFLSAMRRHIAYLDENGLVGPSKTWVSVGSRPSWRR